MGSQGVASLPSFSKSWERLSLGTTHVQKPRLGVSKGMLPVETMRWNKTLMMTPGKHGHQPAQRLGWAALAYHKQKGATPDLGLHKHCLQNDGKPDERLGWGWGLGNVGSMSERSTQVCEELRKRRMDMCCLQEVRWRGQGVRFMDVKGS